MVLTFKLYNIFYEIFRIDAKCLENRVCKISWKFIDNCMTGYQKANFHFGPFSTVGQTIGRARSHDTTFLLQSNFRLRKWPPMPVKMKIVFSVSYFLIIVQK